MPPTETPISRSAATVAFGSEDFRQSLAAALDDDQRFAEETRWFDGSILLEDGTGVCWLKVYRGRVLESIGFPPPFGFSFKLAGSNAAWAELATGGRRLSDLLSPGARHFDPSATVAEVADGMAPPAIEIEGNGFEAGRLREAIFVLCERIAETARGRGNG